MGSTPGPADNNQPLHEVFGANVRRERVSRDMSVIALAHSTGYAPEFVEAVEAGTVLTLGESELDAFAAALGVDVASLVSRRAPG